MTTPAGRIALLAVAAGLATTLAACSGDDGKDSSGQGAGSGSSATAAVTPGSQATAYPVPAGAQATELPSLGVRKSGGYTLTLNTVERVGPTTGLVTATLVPERNSVGRDFTEAGYTLVLNKQTQKMDSNYDFSGVTVSVKGDPNLYQVMRDDEQTCACTRGMLSLKAGVPFGVYAYVTLPEQADTVNVTVRGMAPFTNVKVGS